MTEAIPGNAGRADYPRMLYHADGRIIVVQTPEQHEAQLAHGFSQNPQPVHQQRQATHSGVLSSGEPLALLLREVIEHVLDERGLTKAWVDEWTSAPAKGAGTGSLELPRVPLKER